MKVCFPTDLSKTAHEPIASSRTQGQGRCWQQIPVKAANGSVMGSLLHLCCILCKERVLLLSVKNFFPFKYFQGIYQEPGFPLKWLPACQRPHRLLYACHRSHGGETQITGREASGLRLQAAPGHLPEMLPPPAESSREKLALERQWGFGGHTASLQRTSFLSIGWLHPGWFCLRVRSFLLDPSAGRHPPIPRQELLCVLGQAI